MRKFIVSLFGILFFLTITSLALSQPEIDKTEHEIAQLTKKLDLLKQISKLDVKLKTEVDLGPLLAKLDIQIALLKSIESKLVQVPPVPIPNPTDNRVVVDITFVGPRTTVSADSTLLKWLKDNNVAAYELLTPTPSFKIQVDKVGGMPCIVLRDKDKVVLESFKDPSVVTVKSLVTKYLPQKKAMLTPSDLDAIKLVHATIAEQPYTVSNFDYLVKSQKILVNALTRE